MGIVVMTFWLSISIIVIHPLSTHPDDTATGSGTYDSVYIKDNNSVAVSSGWVDNGCITIIDIESQKVMTTIPMDTYIYLWIPIVLYHVNHNMSQC
jgi:hypothetical protein